MARGKVRTEMGVRTQICRREQGGRFPHVTAARSLPCQVVRLFGRKRQRGSGRWAVSSRKGSEPSYE